MYENDVRRTAILGRYGTAVRSVRNCSENTNVYGVRPFTKVDETKTAVVVVPVQEDKTKPSVVVVPGQVHVPAVVVVPVQYR